MATDASEEVIFKALGSLSDGRFVVVDEDTEEVLLLRFTRADGGFNNLRRLPSIRDAANAIESPGIVRALAAEFDDLGIGAQWRGQASIECLSVGLSEGQFDAEPDGGGLALDAAEAASEGTLPIDVPNTETSQVNRHSTLKNESTESLTAEQRRVPQPTTHNPQPTTRDDPADRHPRADGVAKKALKLDHSTDPDFDEFWNAVPLKNGKPSAYKAWQAALKKPGVTNALLVEKMTEYRDYVKTTGQQKIKYPQGWLTDERWNDELPKHHPRTGGFTPYQNPSDPSAYESWKPTTLEELS